MPSAKVTPEFEAWFDSLSESEAKAVAQVVCVLETEWLKCGYPFSSALEGAKVALRELRPKKGQSPLRPIYAFDPERVAVLITGGDKSKDKKFYENITREAEAIWARTGTRTSHEDEELFGADEQALHEGGAGGDPRSC